MILNEKKTKSMIINFSTKKQFTTRLQLHDKNVEIVDHMKILGTIITDKLKWDKNCAQILTKVNQRMLLLKNIHRFGATQEEMVHLWIVYCRSILEQSAVVWAGSLTQENKDDLERTQKSFAKLILQKQYQDDHEKAYENALKRLNLKSLEQRRIELCLEFAKNNIKNGNLNDLLNENASKHEMKTRTHEKFNVLNANTDRMKKSSVIFMQNLLNKELKEKEMK